MTATRIAPGRTRAGLLVLALLGCAHWVAACGPEPPAPPRAEPDTLRRVAQGELVGKVGVDGAHVWAGIPFAQPPVGDLRWRAPRPPEPWQGRLEALEHGAPCPQYTSLFGGVPGEAGQIVGSEDCLTLNVYAPPLLPDQVPPKGGGLPVLFWIHGGGNTIGHAGFYDGGPLAAGHDVVVVTTQYRLGPFGWFRHESLRGAGTSADDRSGNFGTLDLVQALAWVRDNIAAFGGDPDNVTIFGESAGGTNVFTLLLSPRAAGLFHRAIPQSGGMGFADVVEAENPVDAPEPGDPHSSGEVLLRLVAGDDRAEGRRTLETMSWEDQERTLRSTSTTDILAAYDGGGDVGMVDMPKVFADGHVLPSEDPLEALAAGRWNVVPVLVGTNRDENKLFMYADPRWVRRWFGVIPRVRDPEAYELTAGHMARMWKATGADEPAAAMRRVSPDVFVYRFDWDEEPTVVGADLSFLLGAAHAFEIPFVFGRFELGRAGNVIFTDENLAGRQELSQRMQSWWVQFAREGDPGRGLDGSLPEWQAWSESSDGPKFMVLDTDRDGGPHMSTDALTVEAVIEGVRRDPVLASRDDRCDLVAEIARWSRSADWDATQDCS